MRCKRSWCTECATQFDGINYCVSCLALVRGTDAKSSNGLRTLSAVVVVLAVAYLAKKAVLWGVVIVAALS